MSFHNLLFFYNKPFFFFFLFLKGEVVHVLKRVSLGPEEICSFVIGDACGDVYNPFHEWKVIFPPVPKPEVLEPKVPTVGFFMHPLHFGNYTDRNIFTASSI